MRVKVIDASALAALLFDEPEADDIVSLIANTRLAAPNLIGFEVANVCVMKCRRNPSERLKLLSAFGCLADFRVEQVEVDQKAVSNLALETGLTAYDASYLWLANRLGASIVTLDKQLAKAAALSR